MRQINPSFATARAIRCAVPVRPIAPVVDYDAWLKSLYSDKPNGHSQLTGAQLRRVVAMRRECRPGAEISASVGRSESYLSRMFRAMPESLK